MRYSYVDALLTAKVLEGKQATTVRQILGPATRSETSVWYYDVDRPGTSFVDTAGGGIAVTFDGAGVVTKVEDTRWIN